MLALGGKYCGLFFCLVGGYGAKLAMIVSMPMGKLVWSNAGVMWVMSSGCWVPH